MEVGHAGALAVRGEALAQPLPEEVGEEVVVPVPAPFVVERDDEQVCTDEVLQGPLAGCRRVAEDCIAERAGELVEDGRLQQERLDRSGLLLQDLLDEVVHHEAVAPRERFDEPGRAGSSPHREGRQLQAGDPPLGARLQGGDGFGGEVEAHRVVEEAGGFVWSEAEIGGAHLGEMAPRPQTRQGEGRVLTRRDDEVNRRRQVLDKKGQRGVHRRIVDGVVIVQDEGEGSVGSGEIVEENGEERFGRGRARGSEGALDLRPQAGAYRLERGYEVGEEACQIPVSGVEGQPRGRPLDIGEPRTDQRRLAEPSGGGHERQPAVQPRIQPLDQPRPRYDVGPQRRRVELCG